MGAAATGGVIAGGGRNHETLARGQLLQLVPENRLGNLLNGANDIKAHSWFHANPTGSASFSWDMLLKGQLKAPYVPNIESATDTKHDRRHRGGLLNSSGAGTLTPIGPGMEEYWPEWE